MLSASQLPKTPGRKKKRVGRGDSSSGNYSGRGMKGQRSRSGGKGGLKLRGLKQSMMAAPKKKGFSPRYPASQIVNLTELDKHFTAGAEVNAAVLYEKDLVVSPFKAIKILGDGKLTKKLSIKVQAASKSAQEAITAAGGEFEAIPLPGRQKKTLSDKAKVKAKAKPSAS
ncbi:MAG: 50S ribosomal protein L15 [Candidatus Kerfeldbacteria bacterium CG15_BIG_FIL_POST_REV_8_21_14_020_45_12]|uniref:Large ribosomal subunit protein uL15 n=1 Tax=Candidatus Kerfeldbacteria bacterium CG15_BIG_FIL_POST_REV_8_21_14_020_45_12 TaxID=2014247 RepID=A0A2M7H3S1_9BACT|nr:MAG: 50S ribosomal protein L15 [Candidatus Kerfeldbacteria bacterium CG15_BIG_FIL_POST_REV_8_21_14_020_45_12]PJA94002.1 MAG: 50S ribosomal protein L15 [Candidatus Kerfeldbacteria bacterium CG_4_9_14_3_um_filter_45_8]